MTGQVFRDLIEAALKRGVVGRAELEDLVDPFPEAVAVEVPAVKQYKYMVVNDQVVLVDPVTSEVVAEIAD